VYSIDKATAESWIQHLNFRNEQHIRNLPDNQLIDVAKFASDFTFNFLRGLREVALDPTNSAHAVEHGAHGMMHAVVQSVLWQDPPTVHALTDREKN
jgi:hypothetical protein